MHEYCPIKAIFKMSNTTHTHTHTYTYTQLHDKGLLLARETFSGFSHKKNHHYLEVMILKFMSNTLPRRTLQAL